MRPFRAAGALALASMLAACASEPSTQTNPAEPKAAPAATAATDMVCSREYPTGSNFPVTRCRTREQIDSEKAAAEENLRRTRTGTPKTTMGGG